MQTPPHSINQIKHYPKACWLDSSTRESVGLMDFQAVAPSANQAEYAGYVTSTTLKIPKTKTIVQLCERVELILRLAYALHERRSGQNLTSFSSKQNKSTLKHFVFYPPSYLSRLSDIPSRQSVQAISSQLSHGQRSSNRAGSSAKHRGRPRCKHKRLTDAYC